MPALFALAQHDGLVEAESALLPSEQILSFLDDSYVVTSKERAAAVFRTVADAVERRAGVKSHLGKLRVWSRGGGEAPPGLDDLGEAVGPEVWTGDGPAHENGIVVLGTPLGTPDFVKAHAEERLQKERRLLDELPQLEDVKTAW
eukprot:9112610-Pyramimonas_sp.AAC.1